MVLQSIRERLTGFLAFAIIGILIIPFALVGVSSYFTSSADNLIARVNDREITVAEFTESFGNYRRRTQAIMGASFDPEGFESLVTKRDHLDDLIDEEILNQTASNIRLNIDNERLAQQIREIPAFHVDGEFSLDVYLARLAGQGLSVQQFEQQVRGQFILSQLPTGVLSSSISTRTELEEFVGIYDEQRSFRTILIPPVIEGTDIEFDESEIQNFYNENQSSFQSEEMVLLEYLELDVLDIPLGTEPDEDFLQSRFEDQKGRFISPEQRLISHILIEVTANEDEAVIATAEQSAQDIADRVRAGEDFAELAREFSSDVGSSELGGDLGWMGPGIMSESFETAMYDLSMDSAISDPVQTGFGWHIIQLREIQPSTGMSFEEARITLINEHQLEESEREFLDRADLLVDMIYEDPTTLDSAALDLGIDVQTLGPFGRTGGEGLAANPEVISAAFSELVLLQGSVSDPIKLSDNHLIMVRAREHFPIAVRPLDEVRDEIAVEIQMTRALDVAKSTADRLLAELNEPGTDFETLAETNGYSVILTEAAKRQSFVPDFTVVENVFHLDAPTDGEVLSTVVDSLNGYALVVLDNVTSGSLEEGAVLNEQQYKRQIANSAASIEVTGLLRQLRDAADVEIFEDRLR